MDGVLLITTQGSDQSWHLTSQYFAPKLNLPPQRLEEALRKSSRTYHCAIEQDSQKQRRDRLEPFQTRKEMVERALEEVEREDALLASEMVHMYETLREKHRHLAPHAHSTLQKLREQAFPLALISNGNATYQRRKIQEHHLAPFFDIILIEEEFGVAKPDQRIFEAALNHFQITVHEAWMIGDDLAFDIAAAQHLGIFAIWCDLAQHGLPENHSIQPDRVIHTLPEVFDLLSEAVASS